MATRMSDATIDDVLAQLDNVIARCVESKSRLGYFAILYRNVTRRVQQELPTGRFTNPAQLERLDLIFAQRYLDALEQYWRGETPTRSWAIAFESAQQRAPLILQHLLLGINAHINLDLAIAAAQTAPGAELPTLQHDFDEINNLLIEMIQDVQARIQIVSPWFRLLDMVGGDADEQLGAFGLQTARRRSWQVAQELSRIAPAQLEQTITTHDILVAAMARGIVSPRWTWRATHWIVRMRESDDVPKVIETLRM